MYRHLLGLLLLFAFQTSFAQELTGKQLLENAITFHDPEGQWNTFKGELHIVMTTPNKSSRDSKIRIDLPKEYFYVQAKRDTTETIYELNKDDCKISLNGNSDLSQAELFSKNLSCERAQMYKNYYTYLYGLPMKLKDEGTIIHDRVERKIFKGKQYLVLKVTYDKAVGSDVWYFYFDPTTYAMEMYQFYKTDDAGNEKPLSGEYIILSDTAVINGIKMPKKRAWYYNKDDGYLGTDVLKTD